MTCRVLVARLDSLGDVLLAGPAVRAVAAAGKEVHLLCGPLGAPAGRLLPGVHNVHEWFCPWISDTAPEATPAQIQKLIRLAQSVAPDEAINLTSFHQSPLPLALALRLAGVPKITAASVDYAGNLLDVRLRPGEDFAEDQPESERALTIVGAAGYKLPENDDRRLRIMPTPDVSQLVGDEPYVVMHPGSDAPARAWPPEHFASLVPLLQRTGVRVVVTGGPSERGLAESIANDAALNLAGQTDLLTLAGVLAGASVLIAGNTGPAHLAAAVGTPVVSLFSPVVPPIRWAPYGVPVELLGDQHAACRNTRARQCPIAGHPCLARTTPEEVAGAYLRLTASARTTAGAEAALEGAPA